MVKTGVEKFDKLPPRVGSLDVDSLRATYCQVQRERSAQKHELELVRQKLMRVYDRWKQDGCDEEDEGESEL